MDWLLEYVVPVTGIATLIAPFCPKIVVVSQILDVLACNFGNAKNAKAE